MAATATTTQRDFDHLREHSIGLPGVLFQSITHMAPAAAVAYSIYISVPHAGPALPVSVFLALVACLLAANSIGQLAKEMPSAGGLYTYVARSLGPQAGFMVAWASLLFEPLVAPLLFLIFAWTTKDIVSAQHHGLHWTYTGRLGASADRCDGSSGRGPSSRPVRLGDAAAGHREPLLFGTAVR